MSEAKTCPECGGGLPQDAPKGLCPACLVRVGAGWTEVPRAECGVRNGEGAASPEAAHALCRFPSGQRLAEVKAPDGVLAVRFSPDGRFLALGCARGIVALWELAHRWYSATWSGHFLSTFGLAFSADGRRLLTTGRNPRDAVKLWDVATMKELLVLPAEGQIFCDVGFSPDGNTLVANSLGGVAHFWRAPSWAEIEAAEKGAGTP